MLAGSKRAGLGLLGNCPHGADDFLAAAIIEGDHQGQPGIAARQVLGLIEQDRDVAGQSTPLADDADPDVVGVQLGKIMTDEALQKPHQVRDFLGWAPPILGGKAVDRQVADAEIAGGAHGATDRFDAAAMALEPRQSALGRPAAIAVHDDGDMRRDALAC